MAKLFHSAFWMSIAAFITKVAEKINQHPRFTRNVILILLNCAGFFCFWVLFYGLGLYLVPKPEHPDYMLMRFGVQFVSFVVSLLLSIGLYNLIRGLVAASKFVSDKISGVGKGLKDGGTVAVEIPKQVVDATKRIAEGAVELGKNVRAGVSKTVEGGTKAVKEKAPVVGEAILTAAQKTGEAIGESSKKAAGWSKENIPKAVQRVKRFTATTFHRIAAIFKKKNNDS